MSFGFLRGLCGVLSRPVAPARWGFFREIVIKMLFEGYTAEEASCCPVSYFPKLQQMVYSDSYCFFMFCLFVLCCFAACCWRNTSVLYRVSGFHPWSLWKHQLHWGMNLILLDTFFMFLYFIQHFSQIKLYKLDWRLQF